MIPQSNPRRTRPGQNPVHISSYNPNDKEDVASVKIYPVNKNIRPLVHRIYADGSGTAFPGDDRYAHTNVVREHGVVVGDERVAPIVGVKEGEGAVEDERVDSIMGGKDNEVISKKSDVV